MVYCYCLRVVDADYQVAVARLYEPIILGGMLEVCLLFLFKFQVPHHTTSLYGYSFRDEKRITLCICYSN